MIIQASARSIGNTSIIVQDLFDKTGFEVIDLNNFQIGHFDYQYKNSGDDYLTLMKRIIEDYNTIVFATPVYWYSMSGMMKVFFDRMTDFLTNEKETGRKLRGKNMALISCGSDSVLPEGFTMPFFETASYLGMNYIDDVHTWIEDQKIPEIVSENLRNFALKLKASLLE